MSSPPQKEKRKVLMFGWEFPPQNSGGLGVACLGLSKWLSVLKTDIFFVLPKKGKYNNSSCKFIFADVDSYIQRNEINSPLYPYITSNEYGIFEGGENENYGFGLLQEVLRYGKEGAKIAKSLDFDVIHAHDWLSFPAGIEAKKATGKPLVVHVHATEFDRTGGNGINQSVYKIEKIGMQKADCVIAVSNFVKNILIQKYSIAPEKIEVVHNGFEEPENVEDSFDPLPLKQNGAKIVLFLGRITLQKGPDYFLKAAKRVLEVDDNVYFIIAGSGDMERQIIEEVAYLGIHERVLFAGFLREETLWRMFEAADLFVMPSISEPFGLVPLEAISRDTPILISKQSGVSEVLKNAIKIDFWDTRKMANAIISILNNEALSTSLKEGGKRELINITWKKAAEKCKNIYEKILKK